MTQRLIEDYDVQTDSWLCIHFSEGRYELSLNTVGIKCDKHSVPAADKGTIAYF